MTPLDAVDTMAFEHTLRRWAREHEVSWAAFPIDERQGGRDLRVGYTLLLHARAKGDAPRPPGAGTLSTPETRLVAFIQAYIFTLLTAIFIGVYVHPQD